MMAFQINGLRSFAAAAVLLNKIPYSHTIRLLQISSGSFSQILALDYDIAGAVINRRLGTGGGQTAVPYAYDVAGRIHEIGDVDRVINPDPFSARYSYTPSGLISRMDTRSGAAAQNCSYSSGACTPHWQYSFNYDGLARLSGATYAPVSGLMRGPGYTVSNIAYDPQGNIETLTRNAPTTAYPEGTPVDQLSYNYTPRTNRLASVADAVTTDFDWDASPTSFVYNRVGSVTWTTEELTPATYRETEIQVYDERQLPEELRIRLIATPGGAYDSTMVSYRYDVNGQRIRKQIRATEHGADIVYERYVRDGMRLIGVFDENNTLKNWNIGGAAGLVGRADWDPRLFPPAHSYYITDHLGSIRAVVNPSGTVTEGRDYYPYGLTMPGRFYVVADTTREGFTGHELDPETGLYYAGARFYGSALARWFVPDPLAELYLGWSPYNYTLGNPVIFIDPDGMAVDNDYGLDRLGNVSLIRETNDDFDVLYTVDDRGNVINPDNNVIVNDQSILPQMTTPITDSRERSGTIARSSSRDDMFKIFDFAANNTDVEWGFIAFRGENSREYALGTIHRSDASPAFPSFGFNDDAWYYHIHTHLSDPLPSGWGTSGGNYNTGDMMIIHHRHNRLIEAGIDPKYHPSHYIYHIPTKKITHYTVWNPNIFIRNSHSYRSWDFLR